jgi:sulfate adenylyltransferase subunit 1
MTAELGALDEIEAPSRRKTPLHLATVGSVDDGKSTLIGRLLHDSKAIFEDQLAHIAAISRRLGHDHVDLALLTDGLRAEREQGITIDVAYRYFSTPRRSFVIADCPGHVQYTRNMVTGASRADVAVLLVDARHGVVEQTRRHALVASLLRVPHLLVAVNKMDLVDHSEERFDEVVSAFASLTRRLDASAAVTFIPISALAGDNVVERSPKLGWYAGPTLLDHLETIDVVPTRDGGARFPVQYVVRPRGGDHRDYRGYAGTVAAGRVRVGDDVVVLPAGTRTRVSHIDTFDGALDGAGPGEAVTLRLADDVDVSRGDLIAPIDDPPVVTHELRAVLAWLDGTSSLAPGRPYALKHTTRRVRAMVTEVHHRIDVDDLGRPVPASTLELNDIGVVALRSTEPLVADDYRRHRTTGSFVLIDEATHQTAAAGMIDLAG